MEQKSNMTNNRLAIEGKDILNNLGITLDWVYRVEKDPTQVNLPDDKYEHPQQAVMSITQAITFINEFKTVSRDFDHVKIEYFFYKLHNSLYWVCRIFNDQNMVNIEADYVDRPVETIKTLLDTKIFLRDCISYLGHNPYGDDI